MSGAAQVPLTQFDNADPALLQELLGAVERVARQGAFTLGPEVEQFEQELAAFCGTAHAVGVASGTEALALGLRALDVGPGDEVIVPTNSFVASAEAVTLVGANPRLVDVDPSTHLLTADTVRRHITEATRCVIPVHLYGRTVDMDPILEVAGDAGIRVLEDAAQAHGAQYRGRSAGSIGDAGCFSFYPAKNLGAWGDAGALVTGDPEIADRVRLLRAHGERPRYHHRVCGTTGRIDAIQAAVLRVKLRRFGAVTDARRSAAARLTAALEGSDLQLPAPVTAGTDHVYHQYVVSCEARNALREHLAAFGVATGIHYPVPIHLTGAYAHLGGAPGDLPVAESFAERVCSLPMFPAMTDEHIARVTEAVRSFDQRDDLAAA